MDTLQLVENKLREGSLTSNPHECAELRAKLSGEYSFWVGQLADLEIRKPAMWNSQRKNFKSDSACDKWFEATGEGLDELKIRSTIKRLEKMMMGLNGLLRLAEGEARNQF